MEFDQAKKSIELARATQSGLHPIAQDVGEIIHLGEVAAILMSYKWLILLSMIFSILVGSVVVMSRVPIYRAEGLIQVEIQRNGFEKIETIEPLLGGDTSVSTAIEILRSRMILSQVVERRNLDIFVETVVFPVIGAVVINQYDGDALNSPLFGMSSYAWGGEVVKVSAFDVPDEYLDRQFLFNVGESGGFSVIDHNRTTVLEGVVGSRVSMKGFSIFVAQMKARPGTVFRLYKLSNEKAVSRLRNNFHVIERGKNSGILELSVVGEDQKNICSTLDEIQQTYLRMNVARRSAQAEKTLGFLEGQLPVLKEKVDKAEAAYNSYRQSRGSLDLNLETQGVLESLVEIENLALRLKQEREEISRRFTIEHPTMKAIDAKLARIDERRNEVNLEVSQLPATQQTVLRLARDMEVSTKLYTALLNTAQQLRVSKAGTIGDVVIIDSAAVSSGAVGVSPIAILGLALLLGLLGSVIVIILRKAARVVVEDPELIEDRLGLPVYATVPHSKVEASLERKRKKILEGNELLALVKPDDEAVESLRSLRTTLHFALLDAPYNSLLITSSCSSLGKSFLAKNLSVLLAQQGKRIVIVDADLRRGHINAGFGLKREAGISEYIAERASISEIIKSTSIPNLFVVTSGQIPPNPSELLLHNRFKELLNELNKNFDNMIIDAPPILAVSDAAIIGRCVGATLVVARAGKNPILELEQAVKRLNRAGVEVKGFIFNDIDIARQRARYGYKGYVFHYSYK